MKSRILLPLVLLLTTACTSSAPPPPRQKRSAVTPIEQEHTPKRLKKATPSAEGKS